jgi:hypothetical protein
MGIASLSKSLVTKFGQTALASLALACLAGCAETSTRHPLARNDSAVPPPASPSIYRPPGVLNTPNNTGNPPQDLDPHTVHWGDVRPVY